MSYRNDLKPGDVIITYEKKNFISRAIGYLVSKWGKVSNYRASHSQIYLGNGIIIEASSHGVKFHKIKGYTPGKFRLYIARYENMTPNLVRALMEVSLVHAGDKYAYFQLIVIMFKYIFRIKHTCDVSRRAMVCSELVCTLFKESGVKLFDIPCYEVTPAHYLECPKMNAQRIF